MENETNLTGNPVPPSAPANPVPSAPKSMPDVPMPVTVTPGTTPPPKDVPPQNFITPASATIGNNKKSRFGLFVVIGIVIIILIYAAVTYIYFQNKTIQKGSGDNQSDSENVTVSPTPAFSADNVKIDGGNISYVDGTSETKILVNKSDYPGSGITGFLKLSISPDKNKVCFESWAPAPKPALYLSDVNGTNVVEVSTNKRNCTWTPDSKKILYTNTPTGDTTSDIFSYDIETKEELNITADITDSSNYNYEIVGHSADGSTLICSMRPLDSEEESESCEINLTTMEIVFP